MRWVQVPEDVLVQTLPDGESVFLHLATEEYFALDVAGTAMWRALTETGRTDLALERLLTEFEVDEETLGRDLDAFVTDLSAKGLLRPGADPEATVPSLDAR